MEFRFVNKEKTIAVWGAHYLKLAPTDFNWTEFHCINFAGPIVAEHLRKQGASATNLTQDEIIGFREAEPKHVGKVFDAGLERLDKGGKLLIICPAGVHTSPITAAVLMKLRGRKLSEALKDVKSQRKPLNDQVEAMARFARKTIAAYRQYLSSKTRKP